MERLLLCGVLLLGLPALLLWATVDLVGTIRRRAPRARTSASGTYTDTLTRALALSLPHRTRHWCLPALNRLARRCCSCGQAEVEPRPRWAAGLVRRGLLLLEPQESGSRTVEAEADSTATRESALPPSARDRSLSVPCLNPRYQRLFRCSGLRVRRPTLAGTHRRACRGTVPGMRGAGKASPP